MDEDFVALSHKAHWLQFVYVDVIGKDGKPTVDSSQFMVFNTNERGKYKFVLNGRRNTVVDSIDPSQVFADIGGLREVGTEGDNLARSYFDRPEVGKVNKDRTKADKYVFHFVTIMTYNGKAYYQIKWKYEEPSRGNPITIEAAEPVTNPSQLPPELKAAELSVGYQEVKDADKAELKDPYSKVKNPLDARNRPR